MPTGGNFQCPSTGLPVADQEVRVLCDGTGAPFLRRYSIDDDGTVTVTDTELDGITPFTPVQPVGLCEPDEESPAEPCLHCDTLVLCQLTDGAASGEATIGEDGFPPANPTGNGVGWQLDPLPTVVLNSSPTRWNWTTTASTFTFDRPVDASWTVELTAAPGEVSKCIRYREDVVVEQLDPNHVWDPNSRILCANDGTTGRTRFSIAGATEFTIERLDQAAGLFVDTVTITPLAVGDAEVPFFRTVCRDCAGAITSISDTDLDGQPITVTGEVTMCGPTGGDESPPEPEPCRNTSTLLVCDLLVDGEPDPTVTDTDPTPLLNAQTSPGANPVSGGAAALWSGGTLTIPPDTGPAPDGFQQHTRTFAATVQAPRPACDTGMATVTATMRVERNGPDPGCEGTGSFHLIVGTTQVDAVGVPPRNIPVGTVDVLTVTAQVPAAELAAGNVALLGRLETYHFSPNLCADGSNPDGARIGGWTIDQFDLTVAFDQAGCAQQVFANVVTNCETGAVVSVTYTDTEGNPYTPTGEIGQCVPATPATEPCSDCETITLCDQVYDPQPPIDTPAPDFTLTGNVEVSNGDCCLWFSNADQPVNGVAELTLTGLLPGIPYEFYFDSTWIGAGGPDPANTDAIYQLDILDGATVLATRTRNLSNGSTVFPGGTLAPDNPPLAFIAPTSGQATIRFTDQTSGGGTLRDLFIRPLRVQATVLELTSTPFLRNICRDCNGQTTTIEDTTLNGEPYEVVGEVAVCGPEAGEDEPCRDSTSMLLCDLGDQPAQTSTVPLDGLGDGPQTGQLDNGVSWTVDRGTWHSEQGYLVFPAGSTCSCPIGPQTWTFDQPADVRFGVSGLNDPSTECLEIPAGIEPVSIDPAHTWDPSTRQICGNTVAGAVSVFASTAPLTTFTITPVGALNWGRGITEVDVTVGTPPVQFLRTVTVDCDGNTVSVVDTTLDGDPYTPTGAVEQCATVGGGSIADVVDCDGQNALLVKVCDTDESPAEPPCRNSSTLLVCDIPTDAEPDPVVTDTDPSPYDDICPRCISHCGGGTCVPVPNAAALWSGGTVQFGPDSVPPTGTPRVHRVAAATIQADRPGCDDDTATLTVSVRVQLDGPNEGWAGVGGLALIDTDTVTAIGQVAAQPNAPVGYQDTLTITAQVDAAKLAAGSYVVDVNLETFDRTASQTGPGEKAWTVDQFTADVVYGLVGCETQVFANVVTDCETGDVLSVTYTTLEGDPYTPTGAIGDCQPAAACCPPEPCRNTSSLLVCDIPADGVAGDLTATDTPAGVPPGNPTPAAWPPLAGGGGALWSGGTLVFPADPDASAGDGNQVYRGVAATLQAARPACDDGTATVTVSVHVINDGPGAGAGMSGALMLIDAAGALVHSAGLRAAGSPYPPGYERTLTVTGDVDAADLAAGNISIGFWMETFHGTPKQWTADTFTATYEFNTAGCETQILANIVTDCETGQVESVTYTDMDGQPYEPMGEIGQCTPVTPDPCQVASTFEKCRCDDLSDESPGEIVCYQEIWSISCEGGPPTLIHTYRDDPATEYIPTNPVDCDEAATESAQIVGVQAHRSEVTAGAIWDAASFPLLQSVTFTNVDGGPSTITTADGTTTLWPGETVTYSVVHEFDLTVQGPLQATAGAGSTVTVQWTEAVTS